LSVLLGLPPAHPLLTPLLRGDHFCCRRSYYLGAARFVWLCGVDVAQAVNISIVVEASFLVASKEFAYPGYYSFNDPSVVMVVVRVTAVADFVLGQYRRILIFAHTRRDP
jgi:hypothetical protein